MPRKPRRPCSYPGCPELVEGRLCIEHDMNYSIQHIFRLHNKALKSIVI